MPDTRGMIIAGPLQNVSVAYSNTEYIADRIAPIIDNVPVKAKITVYDKGAWFRNEATIRAPGTRAARGNFGLSYLDIVTKQYAFANAVTDEERRNAKFASSPPIQPDIDAVKYATDKIDLLKEITLADLIFASTWCGVSGGEDAAAGWAADAGTNTFITDIRAGIEAIRKRIGIKPNKLVLDASTFGQIQESSTVRDIIENVQLAIITTETLKQIFQLDEVVIGNAIMNTANQKFDGSDWTVKNVWEKTATKGSAFLCYSPPSPGLKTPSALYHARTPSVNGQPLMVRRYREESEGQDVYEVSEETHVLQVCSDAGYLWVDTIVT
jgi:hypothetical protein